MDQLSFNKDNFVSLLSKIINDVRHLQNNPPDLIPKEGLVVDHVYEVLKPFLIENGGVIKFNRYSFAEGRDNVVLEYHSATPTTSYVSIIGSHMDVVPANPDEWDFNPFEFSMDGDQVRGRGTTDCLGHVALVTEIFRQFGEKKPALNVNVAAVFIANEENSSILGIGVDELVKRGLIAHLKDGPVIWLDSADKHPCLGTAGMFAWHLTARGKLFHSGLPHKAINPIELAMDALTHLQKRFYQDFPTCEQEKTYGFLTSSTMKPTQVWYPGGGLNQIPAACRISGDVRVTPFYEISDVETKLRHYVDELNKNLTPLEHRGPFSKYNLPDENLNGKLEIEFEPGKYEGIACNLESEGHKMLVQATKKILGDAKGFSLTGSLPLVRDLQRAGFDVQIVGYGLMKTYHAKNEYALISDYHQGFDILLDVVNQASTKNAK